MVDIFKLADDFGPEKIVHVYEPRIGLKAIVVVDNVSAGPSIGGTRMVPDISTEECFRLARAMTLKNAAAGLCHGGGKSMIMGDPKMPSNEKEKLIRAFAQAIADIKDYIPGPDMGTDETCMAWIKDEIGRSVGLPRELGGIPLDLIGATGYGVCVAIDVAKDFCGLDLKGARVVIQGFGSVGKHAALIMEEKGTKIIGISDSGGTLSVPNGVDVIQLIDFKNGGKSVSDYPEGEKLELDKIIDIECDIWIPAAIPDIINTDNVDRLKTKIVAQGANIPITLEAEKILHGRGVLVLPDIIANAGGVICAAVEYRGGIQKEVFNTIDETIGGNIKKLLQNAKTKGISTREAAKSLADERVRKIMTYRRTY